MQDIFADIFTNIAVTGGIVRIELGSLKSAGGDGKQPEFETTQRLIMPIEGFVRAFGMTEDVVKRMMAAGIIQKRDGAAEPVAAAPAETKSPNFG